MHNFKVVIVIIAALFCFYPPHAEAEEGIVTPRDYDFEKDENATNDVRVGVTQQVDCRCKNGYCTRNGKAMECSCPPGFGRIRKDYCMECKCGTGFNCSFEGKNLFASDFRKICHCTDGFKDDYKPGSECRAKCNATNPCLNGGQCENELCNCKKQTFYGDFCQHITKCDRIFTCFPRTEVDCVYDLQKDNSKCLCKNRSLVYDEEQRRCRLCPCGNGTCGFDSMDRLRCYCDPGYMDFNKHCKPCDCGNGGHCSFSDRAEAQCKCPDGFADRQGRCIPCNCGLWEDKEIKCNLTRNQKYCFCPEGFENRLGVCEDIDECKRKDACPPGLICNNTIGSYRCQCEEGYEIINEHHPERGCGDIDECWLPSRCHASSSYCVNLPGTYKCVCREGYQPVTHWIDPRYTVCNLYQESWTPTVLTISTAIFLLVVGYTVKKFVEFRNSR